jgi:hypothetical protein
MQTETEKLTLLTTARVMQREAHKAFDRGRGTKSYDHRDEKAWRKLATALLGRAPTETELYNIIEGNTPGSQWYMNLEQSAATA